LKIKVGEYLFKTRCKLENKCRRAQPPLEVTGNRNMKSENGPRREELMQ
jgi:hypothetical protein